MLCQQNKILTPIRDVSIFSHENPIKEESSEQAINYLFLMAFLTILDLSSKTTPSPKKKTVQSTLAFGNTKASASSKSPKTTAAPKGSGDQSSSPVKTGSDKNSLDNSFRQFRRICIKLAEEPSYNAKSKILEDFFEKGASGGWCFYAILGTYLIACFSQ